MIYEYSYILEELVDSGVLVNLFSGTPSYLLSIATYIFSSLALYAIASRRGIRHPWMAWVPVLNMWLMGSLSDQYRYVVKGQEKNKRKKLLLLNIIGYVMSIVMIVFLILMVIAAVRYEMDPFSSDILMTEVLRYAIAFGCACVIALGIGIAAAVVRYMALYDIYVSLNPGNSVLFLVLSILFNVTEAFFLFFNRNKDKGMPPRKVDVVNIPLEEPHMDADC